MENHRFIQGPVDFKTTELRIDKNIDGQISEQDKKFEKSGLTLNDISIIQKKFPFWYRMNIEMLIEVYTNFREKKSLESMQIATIDRNEIKMFKSLFPNITLSIANKIILGKPISIENNLQIAINYIKNRKKINPKGYKPTLRYLTLTRYYKGLE